jgi:hypothetical protein
LNTEIIDRIFDKEKWFFSRLNKKSGHKVILRTLYNTFFQTVIIKSELDKSKKNSKLKIDYDTHKMYTFGINNLRAFHPHDPSPIDDLFID